MNEDQVIGCIRGLQWALKFCSIPKHSRTKLYAQMDEQWARLALLRKEPKPQSVKPQPEPVAPPPPASTPEQIAQRAQKRIELEAKIEATKNATHITRLEKVDAIVELAAFDAVESAYAGIRAKIEQLETQVAKTVLPITKTEPIPYREPAYNEEPSDFRPLPHFGGRE